MTSFLKTSILQKQWLIAIASFIIFEIQQKFCDKPRSVSPRVELHQRKKEKATHAHIHVGVSKYPYMQRYLFIFYM